jgi:8-hydroxy-5-deazaflavin:NADPH oxidoreductase
VVKAFNAIHWGRLRSRGQPSGDPRRIGIPISGDDEEAKQSVAELIDQIGFDAVDAGSLGEGGRKHQPRTAVFTTDLTTEELRARLAD